MGIYVDLTGQQFGRLLILKRNTEGRKGVFWDCRCDCGQLKVLATEQLKSGHTQSCGCLQRERSATAHLIHGLKGTREYTIWKNMRQRCLNPRNPSYRDYGARGITICERWLHSARCFVEDMGPAPSPQHSVNRKDNDGPYSPENCEWATARTQANNSRRNRRLSAFGATYTISEWSRIKGINVGVIIHRLGKLGWTVEDALSKPLIHWWNKHHNI